MFIKELCAIKQSKQLIYNVCYFTSFTWRKVESNHTNPIHLYIRTIEVGLTVIYLFWLLVTCTLGHECITKLPTTFQIYAGYMKPVGIVISKNTAPLLLLAYMAEKLISFHLIVRMRRQCVVTVSRDLKTTELSIDFHKVWTFREESWQSQITYLVKTPAVSINWEINMGWSPYGETVRTDTKSELIFYRTIWIFDLQNTELFRNILTVSVEKFISSLLVS